MMKALRDAITLLRSHGYKILESQTCRKCNGQGHIEVSGAEGDWTTSCRACGGSGIEWMEAKP